MTNPHHFQMPPNLYRLSDAGLNCRAAFIALPAVMLSGMQYGWMGLAVAAVFIAAGSGKINRHALARREKEDKILIAEMNAQGDFLPPDHRIQRLCDNVAQKMGPHRLRVRMVYGEETIVGCNEGTLYLSHNVASILGDAELEWVMAHEIEHTYQPHNDGNPGATRMAHLFNALGVAASLGEPAVNAIGNPSAVVAASLLTAVIVQLANRSIPVNIELRCDKNALLVTGNKYAAFNALHTLTDMYNGYKSPFKRAIHEGLNFLVETHPTLGGRIRHLQKVDTGMRHDASTVHAPAP